MARRATRVIIRTPNRNISCHIHTIEASILLTVGR